MYHLFVSVVALIVASTLCCLVALRYRCALVALPVIWLPWWMILRTPTETLRIQNFVEYIPQQIIDDFEKETGVTVVYDVIPDADGSVLDFQLLMKSSHHDIVLLSLYKARALFELGLLLPIENADIYNRSEHGRTSRDMSHATQAVPKVLCQSRDLTLNDNIVDLSHIEIPYDVEKSLVSDGGNVFCMPYVCGALGVAYDAQRVQMALGGIPKEPLDLVFNPEVVRKLHDAGLVFSIADAPLEIIPCLAMYLGYKLQNYSSVESEAVYLHLARLRQYYDKIHLTLYMRDIDSNRADVVLGWSTFLQAAVQKNPRFVFASSGRHQVTWMDVLCIPKDSKNYSNALKFIEFISRPCNIEVIRNQYCGNRAYQPGVNYPRLSIDQMHEVIRFWQLFKFGIA